MPRSVASRGSRTSAGEGSQNAAMNSDHIMPDVIAETQERVQTPPRKRARRTRTPTNSSTSSSTSRSSEPVPASAMLIELTTILGSRGEYHMRQLVSKLVDRRRNNEASILSTVINVIIAGAGCKELVRPGDVDAAVHTQGVSSAAVDDLAQMVVEAYQLTEGGTSLPRLVVLRQKLALSSAGKKSAEKSSSSRLRHLRNFECFFRTLYYTLAGDGMDGLQLIARLNSFLLGVPGSTQRGGPSLATVAVLHVRMVATVAACAGCVGLLEIIKGQEADIKHAEMTAPLGGRVPSRSAADHMKQSLERMMGVLRGMTSILGLDRCHDSSESIRALVLSHAGFASWMGTIDDEDLSAAVIARLVPGLADRSPVVRGTILEQTYRSLKADIKTVPLSRPQLATLAPCVLRRCFDLDSTVRLWAVKCLNAIVESSDALNDDHDDIDVDEGQVLSDQGFQLVSNLVWHPELALRSEAMLFVDAHVFGDPGVLRGWPVGEEASSAESTTALLMIVEFIIQYGNNSEIPELTYRLAEAIYSLSPTRRCYLCCFISYTALLLGLDTSQQASQPSASPAEKTVLLALLLATVRLCGSEFTTETILEGLNGSTEEPWIRVVLEQFRNSPEDLVLVAEIVRQLLRKDEDCKGLDSSSVEALESLLIETTDDTLLSLSADLLSVQYAVGEAPAVLASLQQKCSELVQLPGNTEPLTLELHRMVALSKHWDVIGDDYSLLANLLELADRRVAALEANSPLENVPAPELITLVLLTLILTSMRRLYSEEWSDGTAAEEHQLCIADLGMLCLGIIEHDVAEEAAGLRFTAFVAQLFLLDLIGNSDQLRGDRSPADVDRILGEYVQELMLEASLPGERAGHVAELHTCFADRLSEAIAKLASCVQRGRLLGHGSAHWDFI
ncbi:hypothetical protein Pmar_PMAR023613 [Perkinsus marinus ATCC 50983]|uniref:Uncharacterized protein n=1 Tax=Perkinsus marinus (strain ATCC 50983 / TXsc) TaxID=423536 RepID=C5KCU3_PERM5|nr:hypothetical protein Pmar_PMAR023613 [Perkinsus marinus ATCC 50983]EER17692.1 hypothetical protein Pmar_PMAR023613 [Perkinsus marinus ATCC 50983]|eukprot:XP_002785896.1 hypothetical protein Pmar_PMAR023613 [Perkinsus marinus ATCC 50983]